MAPPVRRWGLATEMISAMQKPFFQARLAVLSGRLSALTPSVDRAHQSVRRLETEQVSAGAAAGARAAQLAAARAMAATLEERRRQVEVAISALQGELVEA